MTEEGPCLRHCYNCSVVTVILARISFIHLIASLVYLVMSRNIGTPFKDSLTPKQVEIKKQSADARRKIFVRGIGIGILMSLTFQKA